MKSLVIISAVLVSFVHGFEMTPGREIEHREVKCGVCKASVLEMEAAIAKVDSYKKADVGSFRLSPTGEATSKKIPLVKSEQYLTELMEEVCEKMEDYARARYKKNGKPVILKMITDSGSMNPLMSQVDFVQDADLNKSLKHLCLEIQEDQELEILKMYMADETPTDVEFQLCTKLTGFCTDTEIAEDYNLEDDEEGETREEL